MNYFGLLGAILGIAGAIGAASAVFFATRQRALITLLKEENEALGNSNTRLEKELEVTKTQCEAAAREAEIWKNAVTQAPSIVDLTKNMNDNNNKVISELSKVAAELAKLTKQFGRNMRSKN